MTKTTATVGKTASDVDLDNLMERIRAEVVDRKRSSGALAQPSELLAPNLDFATRRWTAGDLLTIPGAEFVRAVHLAFLGREPTPEEFVRLRDRVLVAHVGRMRILREFRRSSEARTSGRKLDGFWRASVWDRIYWSPPSKFGRFVGNLFATLVRIPELVREFITRIELLERRSAEANAAIRAVQSAQARDRQSIGGNMSQLLGRIEATKEALDKALARRAGALENSMQKQQEIFAELRADMANAKTALVDHWRAIMDQQLQMRSLVADSQTSPPRVLEESVSVASEQSHSLDPLYLSFEDRYRGTRAEIKERQRIYLPHLETCVKNTEGGDVIDVGCGRGEWLELLGEAGIPARGFDLNRIAVAECRERGLDALVGDAVEILSGLSGNTCSAITGFHVVEHIPFETLVMLLDHSLRVLRPGGLLILETPNPANVIVAAERFYLDPTHRNPLPSELMSYLMKSRGFYDIEIVPLHPVSWNSPRQYDDPMLVYLQDKLFGPQDYAVIGRKPA